MRRSKTLAIKLDTEELFDLEIPGENTNTNCGGTVRIQVWQIQLYRWLDNPRLTTHLTIEGRRYRPDGTLFPLHVRATVAQQDLPAEWLGEILRLEQM